MVVLGKRVKLWYVCMCAWWVGVGEEVTRKRKKRRRKGGIKSTQNQNILTVFREKCVPRVH